MTRKQTATQPEARKYSIARNIRSRKACSWHQTREHAFENMAHEAWQVAKQA